MSPVAFALPMEKLSPSSFVRTRGAKTPILFSLKMKGKHGVLPVNSPSLSPAIGTPENMDPTAASSFPTAASRPKRKPKSVRSKEIGSVGLGPGTTSLRAIPDNIFSDSRTTLKITTPLIRESKSSPMVPLLRRLMDTGLKERLPT